MFRKRNRKQTRKVLIFLTVANLAPKETLILRSVPCFAWRASRRMAARPMVRDGAEEAPPHHEVPLWSRHESREPDEDDERYNRRSALYGRLFDRHD
jgi:hypothetical protein